jgi:uncharacterized repeat protein (TIGR02543 family)
VKYDANGGTAKESSARVEKGKSVKLPAAEREGFTFKGWYTADQTFIGKAGSAYRPDQDITLFAKWEKASSSGSNSSAGEKNNSDAKTETSTSSTVTDRSAGTSAGGTAADKGTRTSSSDAGQDKNAGISAGNTGTNTQKEPVIQTGRTTPIYLFAALGFFGILLAAFSIHEGKRSSSK